MSTAALRSLPVKKNKGGSFSWPWCTFLRFGFWFLFGIFGVCPSLHSSNSPLAGSRRLENTSQRVYPTKQAVGTSSPLLLIGSCIVVRDETQFEIGIFDPRF